MAGLKSALSAAAIATPPITTVPPTLAQGRTTSQLTLQGLSQLVAPSLSGDQSLHGALRAEWE